MHLPEHGLNVLARIEQGEDWHGFEEIDGGLVSYSDSDLYYPSPPKEVEEIRLAWLDGSSITVQMRRPPGWRKGMPEGQAEGFRNALRHLLWDLFNGEEIIRFGPLR